MSFVIWSTVAAKLLGAGPVLSIASIDAGVADAGWGIREGEGGGEALVEEKS